MCLFCQPYQFLICMNSGLFTSPTVAKDCLESYEIPQMAFLTAHNGPQLPLISLFVPADRAIFPPRPGVNSTL